MINIEFENFFHIKNKGSLNVQTTKDNNDEKFNVTLSNFAVKEKTSSSQVTVSDSNLNINEPIFVETVLNNQDLRIQKDGFNISPFKLINSIEKKTIEKL
ncbi:MAG: hypothetical protein H7263_02055, partial [Candidatus Sericytochromatia bacterium]|nr:hypothetical protein [Candidatus Sericytochromatia bacterium]